MRRATSFGAVETRLARLLRGAHGDGRGLSSPGGAWAPLVRAACRHRVGGILLQAAERQGWAIPASGRRALRQQACWIEQDNERLRAALAKVTAALTARGLDVLLLKGCALNLSIYGNHGLRAMSDLDVMVRESQVDRAGAVLEALGCRRGPALLRADFFPRYYYATEYRTPGLEPVRIDLHVRPLRPLRYAQTVPAEGFWSDALGVEVGESWARVPSDEVQLIHLAAHVACHDEVRLVWLVDVLRLIDGRRGSIDWGRVLGLCRAWRLALPVRVALGWVERIWGPVVPGEFRGALGRERAVWRDRLCLIQAPRDAKHPIARAIVDLLCTRGVRFRAGYLGSILFPGRAHLAQLYHGRHFGWTAVAMLQRMMRAGARLAG